MLAVAWPAAAAVPAGKGPQELWEQFPLDAEGAATTTARSQELPTPPRGSGRIEAVARVDASSGGWGAWQRAVTFVALGFLLTFAAAAAVLVARGSLPATLGARPSWSWPTIRREAAARHVPLPSLGPSSVATLLPSRSLKDDLMPSLALKPPLRPRDPERATVSRDAKPITDGVEPTTRTNHTPPAPTEVDRLKQKAVPDVARTLKAKLKEGGRRHKKDLAGPKPHTQPTRRPPPSSPALVPQRRRVCEIQWLRRYVKSEFLAIETTPDGAADIVAGSQQFLWAKGRPPTRTPQAAAAYDALLQSLEAEGWRVTGSGANWFDTKLERTET